MFYSVPRQVRTLAVILIVLSINCNTKISVLRDQGVVGFS